MNIRYEMRILLPWKLLFTSLSKHYVQSRVDSVTGGGGGWMFFTKIEEGCV